MVWLGPILESPSAERSKHPIWKLLRNKVFTDPHQRYEVLEIAAGSGIHMEYIIQRLDRMHRGGIQWYPTDTDPAALASLEARRQEEHMAALLQDTIVGAPLPLTLIESGIQEETTRSILPSKFDVIININMIHISPWTATMGLVKVASQFLRPGGVLYLFGPFKVNGMSAPLNRKFDQLLQSKDPSFGIRNLEDVVTLANQYGLYLEEVVEMPANNLSVIFRKNDITTGMMSAGTIDACQLSGDADDDHTSSTTMSSSSSCSILTTTRRANLGNLVVNQPS